MFDRTIEFWVGLMSACIYLYFNSREKTPHHRILMVAASAGAGISLDADVSAYLSLSENAAAIGTTLFFYFIIDLVTALITDREFIKELIKKRFK